MASLIDGEVRPLLKRNISEDTCRKFGYRTGTYQGEPVQIADYHDADGNVVAQKVRTKDKDFTVLGDLKQAGLFGQHLWRDKGKMVVITEGEIDALTVSQLQDNKWPVVSVSTGAKGAKKSLAKHLDWLLGFETIVLFFDNDEPGREATAECAALFPPGRVKVARMAEFKDPNDALVKNRGGEVISAIWGAKVFRPDGIVSLGELKERARQPIVMGLPWFSPTLTELTYGRRYGELYALGAGTGIGKSEVFDEQIVYDVTVLKQKVAAFKLEQDTVETAKRLSGKHAGKRFHVPDSGWTQEELDNALDELDANQLLFLYDNFGATDWDVIASTIRYLAHAEGVKLFYLDHLTALAAGQPDEREALERIMSEMAALAKELGVIIHFVSHLATPEGKPHEEGGRVTIRHFKGSRAIGFWSHYMFGLERDQQSKDERWRHITTFRVLKDRYTGQATGKVFHFGYNPLTGKLFETEPPEKEDANPFRSEVADQEF